MVPLAYGIHKLQISCVVEDEKVSIDWLQETLQQIEDFVSIFVILENYLNILIKTIFFFRFKVLTLQHSTRFKFNFLNKQNKKIKCHF